MDRWLKLLVLTFLVLFLCVGNAMSMNITIYDENGYSGSGQGGEDNETEPGMVNTQIWDLEAFLLDGTTLTMVGGYNFETGEVGNGHTFKSGDIFIGRNVLYGADAAIASDGSVANSEMKNVFGYEYAIDFNFTPNTDTYTVYKIDDSTDLKTSYYYNYGPNDYANQASNPVALYDPSKLTELDSGELDFGTNSDGKYYLSVNLGFLLDEGFAGEEFYTHFTMECGNDNFMGKGVAPVPEPATMLLLGTGLIGLAGASRKKFKK